MEPQQKSLSEYTTLELANHARDGEQQLQGLQRGLTAIYGELARRQINQARAEEINAGRGPKAGVPDIPIPAKAPAKKK